MGSVDKIVPVGAALGSMVRDFTGRKPGLRCERRCQSIHLGRKFILRHQLLATSGTVETVPGSMVS